MTVGVSEGAGEEKGVFQSLLYWDTASRFSFGEDCTVADSAVEGRGVDILGVDVLGVLLVILPVASSHLVRGN